MAKPQKNLVRWAAVVPISAPPDGPPVSFLSAPLTNVANGGRDFGASFTGLWCMSCRQRTTELLLGIDARLRCLLCHQQLSPTIESLEAGGRIQSRRLVD